MDIGVNGFLQQLPPILPISLCLSVLALISVALFAVRRRTRITAVAAPMTGFAAGRPASTDMPDLNDLITSPMATSAAGGSRAVGGSSPQPAPSRPKRGTYSVRLRDGTTVEAVETLVVLRDVHEGGLIAQIGDDAYRLPAPEADAAFARRLSAVARALSTEGALSDESALPNENAFPNDTRRPLAGFAPPSSPIAAPLVSPAPRMAAGLTVPDAPDVPVLPATPLEAESGSADAAIEMPEFDHMPPMPPPPLVPRPMASRPPVVAAPGDLPNFRMPETMDAPPRFGRRVKKPSSDPIPEINIAASIEAFLQHKLSMAEEWRGHSLHVSSARDGGVQIEVDGRYFDSVGAVDDTTARAFLAATIEEWQSRQR